MGETRPPHQEPLDKEHESPTFYDILGVSPEASLKEIKKAFHKQAFKYHPDQNPSPDATHKMRVLLDVYGILREESSRKFYDDRLKASQRHRADSERSRQEESDTQQPQASDNSRSTRTKEDQAKEPHTNGKTEQANAPRTEPNSGWRGTSGQKQEAKEKVAEKQANESPKDENNQNAKGEYPTINPDELTRELDKMERYMAGVKRRLSKPDRYGNRSTSFNKDIRRSADLDKELMRRRLDGYIDLFVKYDYLSNTRFIFWLKLVEGFKTAVDYKENQSISLQKFINYLVDQQVPYETIDAVVAKIKKNKQMEISVNNN